MDIDQGIRFLREQILKISDIASKPPYGPQFKIWNKTTIEILEAIFDNETVKFYKSASPPRIARSDNQLYNFYQEDLVNRKETLIGIIEEHERFAETGLSLSQGDELPEKLSKISPGSITRKVFLVHGHDQGTKETVARFLESIDLEPVILHEQANEGRTIIEKFEEYSDVPYAVVLLTPDDLGGRSGGDIEPSPRARQNVIFEFGYFIGKLGRDRVCGLKKGNIEIPSDYSGVIYIDFDASGTWKVLLIKEMKAVGFEIDANKAL